MSRFDLCIFDFAPWRLSGVVYGTLMNDPAALAALGDAVHAPPYKAPPRAPVLYLKPRNTLAREGAVTLLPAEVDRLEIGATLGIVIGRAACRVSAAEAHAFIAGWTLVADLCVPHDSFYRPNVRLRALDGSCLVGPRVVPRTALGDPDACEIRVRINDGASHVAPTHGMQRPVARLLQDVTDFMTLHAGDVLMLGVRARAPQAAAGDRYTIEADGIGKLYGRVMANAEASA
jgi:5-oxopent-3-ene-1,2,5-tricarboxylate decarboxylase / 2-hydroxyhepta-2,4-diene-1,7-dioate isomerase